MSCGSVYFLARVLNPYGRCQAFAFGKGDDIAMEYLKELRQNGTDRRTEMSTLISGGFAEYQAIKEAELAEVSTNNVVCEPFFSVRVADPAVTSNRALLSTV